MRLSVVKFEKKCKSVFVISDTLHLGDLFAGIERDALASEDRVLILDNRAPQQDHRREV